MDKTSDRQAPTADADMAARVAALETLMIILVGRVENSNFGFLDAMKDEVVSMQAMPARRNDAQISASDTAMLTLIERALNSASLTGGQAYRWKLWARRIVQRWRGPKPS